MASLIVVVINQGGRVGLLPGNRTKDNEKFGLKFRSENKEFNSDEKVEIH